MYEVRHRLLRVQDSRFPPLAAGEYFEVEPSDILPSTSSICQIRTLRVGFWGIHSIPAQSCHQPPVRRVASLLYWIHQQLSVAAQHLLQYYAYCRRGLESVRVNNLQILYSPHVRKRSYHEYTIIRYAVQQYRSFIFKSKR